MAAGLQATHGKTNGPPAWRSTRSKACSGTLQNDLQAPHNAIESIGNSPRCRQSPLRHRQSCSVGR